MNKPNAVSPLTSPEPIADAFGKSGVGRPYSDELDIPLNTPQGQMLLGARDLIAGEAFGDKP